MENNNVIYGINGPVVTVKNTDSFEMMEMVHVGKQKLVGEYYCRQERVQYATGTTPNCAKQTPQAATKPKTEAFHIVVQHVHKHN